jgi:hypothetical protein
MALWHWRQHDKSVKVCKKGRLCEQECSCEALFIQKGAHGPWLAVSAFSRGEECSFVFILTVSPLCSDNGAGDTHCEAGV